MDSTQETFSAKQLNDIPAFLKSVMAEAKEYDRIGRSIKAAPTCDDPTWATMSSDLGDSLIEIGNKMSLITKESIFGPNGVGQLEEIGHLISGIGNQFTVMSDYLNRAEGT